MIIGLIGHARSGKDTAASVILEKGLVKGLKRYALAGPIKECVNALFEWDGRHSDGNLKEALVYCQRLNKKAFSKSLARHGLPEKVGHRTLLNEFLTRLIIAHERAGHTIPNWYVPRIAYQVFGTDTCRELLGENIWVDMLPDRAVVSDVRYPNEAEAIKAKGGILLRIQGREAPKVAAHSSEEHVNRIIPDAYVDNSKGLKHLEQQLKAAIELLVL